MQPSETANAQRARVVPGWTTLDELLALWLRPERALLDRGRSGRITVMRSSPVRRMLTREYQSETPSNRPTSSVAPLAASPLALPLCYPTQICSQEVARPAA